MKNNTKSLTAILAVTILLSGAGFILTESIDEAYASQVHNLTDDVYHQDSNNPYTRTLTFSGPGGGGQNATVVSVQINGTTYDKNSNVWETEVVDWYRVELKINLPLPAVQGTPYMDIFVKGYISFGLENTFSWTTKKIMATTEMSVTVGDEGGSLPFAPFHGSQIVEGNNIPGISFKQRHAGNIFIVPEGTFTHAGEYTVLTNYGYQVTITVNAPMLEIPYVEPSDAIAESNWVYNPTSLSGVTVVVTGPNWLSVNGSTIYGIPPAPGDYEITVKMSKAGYADCTKTFTLTAVSKLVITNSPLVGVIFAV